MAKKTNGRVMIPESALERLRLANVIYQRHIEAGNNSELDELPGYDWAEIGPMVTQALEYHEQSVTLRQQAEDLMEKRNQLLKPIMEITRATSVYLKAKHRGNAKHLGIWGYTVDDSPQVKKKTRGEAEAG